MKSKIIIFCLCFSVAILFFASISKAGQNLRTIENNAFRRGEKVSYRAYYDSFMPGYITVGDVSIEILEENSSFVGRTSMHIIATIQTRRFFNWFFKVDNRYESYIDDNAIIPWRFTRNIYEGGYIRDDTIAFDHFQNKAHTNGKELPITDYIQDIISGFYYLRTIDFSDARPGDEFDIDFFFKDKLYITKYIFDGRERIRTKQGTYNTLRMKPVVLVDSVFIEPYAMRVWFSDDENKIPVLMQSDLIIGNAKLELTGYEGLKNPVSAKIRK